MATSDDTNPLLAEACKWAEAQEKIILDNGIELSDDQKADAFLAGVKDPNRVRLLYVDKIPLPENPELTAALNEISFIAGEAIGLTLRHGIYIKQEHRNSRRVHVHELAHTMQYERLGGFSNFLRHYIDECLSVGYPFGPLEREASEIEKRICG